LEFDATGKGACSGIDYQKDFNSYREFIQAKAGTPYHKALLKFYNNIIFKAQWTITQWLQTTTMTAVASRKHSPGSPSPRAPAPQAKPAALVLTQSAVPT